MGLGVRVPVRRLQLPRKKGEESENTAPGLGQQGPAAPSTPQDWASQGQTKVRLAF